MTKKGIQASVIIIAIVFMIFSTIRVNASQDYTVTPAKAVLYSVGNGATNVYSAPELTAPVITSLDANFPVQVTGVTSNGWFQIDMDGMKFIPGNGLKGNCEEGPVSVFLYKVEDIPRLTQGTFSFYKSKELKAFTKENVEEMDENSYLKYLDSFLIGDGVVDYCIIREKGLTLKAHYDGVAQCDEKVKAMSLKQYLLNYRMEYLDESLRGPVRNEKSLKQLLTRAIRYEKKNFNTIYKNVGIGSDKEKMEESLTKIIEDIRFEQGVTISYKMEYGSYNTTAGKESSGWLIDFSF